MAEQADLVNSRAAGGAKDKRPRTIFFINTLPKSASRFILHTLRDGYRAKIAVTAGGQFPNSVLARGVLQRLRTGRHIAQEHLFPNRYNRLVLEEQLDRMVVHVRDPRQTLLSWLHHLDKEFAEGRRVPLQILGVREDYPALPLSDKLDYVIESHLQHFTDWLAAWRDVLDNGGLGIPVLLTRFEDMTADPQGFFRRIVQFYGLEPEAQLVTETPEAGKRHFRSGRTDEWRSAASASQQAELNGRIGADLLAYYGWPVA